MQALPTKACCGTAHGAACVSLGQKLAHTCHAHHMQAMHVGVLHRDLHAMSPGMGPANQHMMRAGSGALRQLQDLLKSQPRMLALPILETQIALAAYDINPRAPALLGLTACSCCQEGRSPGFLRSNAGRALHQDESVSTVRPRLVTKAHAWTSKPGS
jgi:hypothetical protein